MKKYSGIIFILSTFLLTYLFWTFEQPVKTVSIYRQYSQLIASVALVALTWVNYISTRHKYIDTIFNGLDKSYIYHKFLSILSIILIWVHNSTLEMGGFSGGHPSKMKGMPEGFNPPNGMTRNMEPGLSNFFISGKELGNLSMLVFTGLVILFIITYKLEYQRWKVVHKLILIPYVFGVIHYYLDSDYKVFTTSAFSIWMNLVNVVGALSAIYSIFLYEFLAFKFSYKVSNMKEIAKNTLEITGVSIDKEMKYRPGQFAFMKVLDRKKGFPSHPFTMSQVQKSNEIQFAIKELGDHTSKLKNSLVIGDTIALSGPYGEFDFRTGIKNQIWVAGGIGITPFRSFLQTNIPPDYNIDFFYAYNNQEEGAYVDEIRALKTQDNLRIHLIDSSKNGFLGNEDFEKVLNKNDKYDVYFCGPKVMRIKLKKDLKDSKYKVNNFYYEHFNFK